MAKLELTKKEFDVLVALKRVAEKGGLSQRELVEKTGLSLGTVNRTV